ncbi:MAG: Rrf2 family transcriptional regulator [Candidatus Rokubacteria bacterium]|nr:Rrf2 family transcriptional regulator [Candidatus Rokubacteria bacterium]MBI3825445.1 Rrf2 family transcriptional regulator [Candidatus Rokubacteria bacterium]
MRISAKGEYAIKAMLELALTHGRGLLPIQEIAARRSIPPRYLEQVLLALKQAGLLASKRGLSGGYELMRPPDQITVGAVLRAVEGESAPFEPAGGAGDDGDLAELWDGLSEAVSHVVDGLTFEDLARRARDRRSRPRAMYHI